MQAENNITGAEFFSNKMFYSLFGDSPDNIIGSRIGNLMIEMDIISKELKKKIKSKIIYRERMKLVIMNQLDISQKTMAFNRLYEGLLSKIGYKFVANAYRS